MAGLTKEQRAERDRRAADAAPDDSAPAIGAVEQLTVASRDALKAGQHAEHAALESALFALYTARSRLAAVDLDGPVGAVKALL
jgi:hypothetical protein